MKPLLLFSERERRAEKRANRVIVAVVSVLFYLLLWKWGVLSWSVGGMALVVAAPLILTFLAAINNPIELTVACVLLLGLTAVGLPSYRKVQERKRGLEELRKRRDLTNPRAPHPTTPAPTGGGS